MDPQIDLPELVEDLEVNIDELSTALEPLLATPLHTTASSLPLLDKAKLYCLSAYAIESLLFASLTASGVNATEHAIFKEIARLRQYNTKIKVIEDRGIKGSAEGRARLDVAAAGRFIKHGLAGNDKYDLERQERMARERARAHLKAQQINKKFDDEGKEVKGEGVTPKKRGADEVDDQDESDEELEGLEESEPAIKKARVNAAEPMDIDSEAASSSHADSKKQKKKDKAKGKRGQKKRKQSTEDSDVEAGDDVDKDESLAEPQAEMDSTRQAKQRGRLPKKDKKAAKQEDGSTDVDATPSQAEARVTRKRNKRLSNQNMDDDEGEEEGDEEKESMMPTPDRAPKTRSETFTALLDGSIGDKHKKSKAGGGKGGKRGGKGKGK